MQNFDPATAQNNEDVERHWAIKAFQHAEIYFNLISSTECQKVKLTKIDQHIYNKFRTEFPDLNIEHINEDVDFKSELSKEKWRNFIVQFENDVDDYNFGTLLRNRCDEDYGPENSFFVPRIQFLCIEIARNRERLNAKVFQNKDILEHREVVDSKELDVELEKLQAKIVEQLD